MTTVRVCLNALVAQYCIHEHGVPVGMQLLSCTDQILSAHVVTKNTSHHLGLLGQSTIGIRLLHAILKRSRRDLVVMLNVVV